MVSYPKAKEYQKMKIPRIELASNKEDKSSSDTESSYSEESEDEESEGEYLDEKEETQEEDKEDPERNWWNLPTDSE